MSWLSSDFKDATDGNGLRPSTIVHFICYAVLLGLVALLVHVWVQESVGRARAEATSEAEKRVQKAADDRIEARDKIYRDDIEALKKENQRITNLKQAVQVIKEYLPAAAPQTVTKADLPPAIAAKLPDSPGYSIRSEEQEVVLAKELNVCQQDRAGKTKCEADLKDVQGKLDSMTTDRDSWKQAANGGSKLRRFAQALKYVGIGVGIGLALGAK